jgi:hypothetical protein
MINNSFLFQENTTSSIWRKSIDSSFFKTNGNAIPIPQGAMRNSSLHEGIYWTLFSRDMMTNKIKKFPSLIQQFFFKYT